MIASATIEEIAASLYETYSAAVGGRAFDGSPLPKWPEFAADPKKEKQANAWRVVAAGVQAEARALALGRDAATKPQPEGKD